MTEAIKANPVGTHKFLLGEGPRWVGDRFLFVDILNGKLFELEHDSSEPKMLVHLGDIPLGAVAPTTSGRYIVAAGGGVALLAQGELHWLGEPEANRSTSMRMNDAVADSKGRFWAGSMAYDNTEGAGSLYRVDSDGSVNKVLGDLTIPNGPAINADADIMYLADSALGVVYRIEIDEAGELGPREVFLNRDQFGAASPDGMTIDAEGNLWVALWGGAEVHAYNTQGNLTKRVAVGANQVTAPCFGGPEMQTLLITTAAVGAEDDDHAAGELFTVAAGVSGLPAAIFDDKSLI